MKEGFAQQIMVDEDQIVIDVHEAECRKHLRRVVADAGATPTGEPEERIRLRLLAGRACALSCRVLRVSLSQVRWLAVCSLCHACLTR